MFRPILSFAATLLLLITAQASEDAHLSKPVLPDLSMKQNGLPFSLIQGYLNYKVVATHFRTDKKELRYILANPVAYHALEQGKKVMPEGSKIVKIGWNVKPMELFPAALEADRIQRVEYMVKDSKRFDHNGDHWGYARFVKKGDAYTSWKGAINDCISCHSVASGNDFLFATMQRRFE